MSRQDLVATGGGYGPEGWVQWPDDQEFSFQFVRILASAQERAATIGECFQAAGRITAGDKDSWHESWMATGQVNLVRAEEAESNRRWETAKFNYLRATNYFRSAEFFLDPQDARRLPTFDLVEQCSHKVLGLMSPRGEVLRIPYDGDDYLDAYFLPSPTSAGPRPAVIFFGGLDEFKDELIEEVSQYALPRGFSILLIDLPGQGGTLRRRNLAARPDTEVPVGACVDYLMTRNDVDADRIGLYGASLGGYYSARAASMEPRLKCAVVDGAQWNLGETVSARPAPPPGKTPSSAALAQWVFGQGSYNDLVQRLFDFDLSKVIHNMKCPLLIVHGSVDTMTETSLAGTLYDNAKANGVDVELKWFTPETTGAAHCQCDNPTLGMEYLCDWLGEKLSCLPGQ